MNKAISISDNGDGTSTLVVPTDKVSVVQECLYIELRNERIKMRFIELRKRMKVDDAFSIIGQELLLQGVSLSRSSLVKIVYPLPDED